ncbi:MAG: hypothetical protein Kow0029_24090 [Candidatus Rifleibacteriota bacterium]
MNIYYGIPSGSLVNFEEKEIARRLISALSDLKCHTRDFTTDDPYPFDAVKGTPSLIHAFNLVKSGIPCQKLAEASRLPLVISCTGLDVYADIHNPALRPHLHNTLESASKVIVPFPSMARFLKARLQISTSFEIIPPGVIPLEIEFDFPGDNFGFADSDRLIMLEGGLIPAKNAIFAIHSIDKIISDYPDLKLVIFEQPADTEYKRRVETEAATRPWVRIISRPETEILPYVYNMAELFINVSHAEGYNPFLLNAMQLGKPILASDIHGNNAYVRNEMTFPDNGTGLLYFTSPVTAGYERIHDADDFIEKLRYLLDNPEAAKVLGQRAKNVITKSFSIQKEVYLHLQLYKNLLK